MRLLFNIPGRLNRSGSENEPDIEGDTTMGAFPGLRIAIAVSRNLSFSSLLPADNPYPMYHNIFMLIMLQRIDWILDF